jgi:hypothetical protein
MLAALPRGRKGNGPAWAARSNAANPPSQEGLSWGRGDRT